MRAFKCNSMRECMRAIKASKCRTHIILTEIAVLRCEVIEPASEITCKMQILQSRKYGIKVNRPECESVCELISMAERHGYGMVNE